jgi:phosphoribosylformimino-5-aminoimidazole carboxamide ribotide isomerase
VNLYPAIDILGGNAVRLVRGDFDASTVYDHDPLAAALAWVRGGARFLHVVDLDGARAGEPVNLEQLRRIAAQAGVPVQYGGGLRSVDAVAAALDAGAARVVLGTVALTDRGVLDEALLEHSPERVLVAVDVRHGRVATHGWVRSTDVLAREAFVALGEAGVRHFLFTNIDHDGMLDGANRDEVIGVARAAGGGSVIVSGGIGSLEDLRALAALRTELGLTGLDGVIVGKALYEGRFTVAEALEALSA